VVARGVLDHVNVAIAGSGLSEGDYASLALDLDGDIHCSGCTVPEVGDAIRALLDNVGLVDSVVRRIAGTL